VLPLHHRAIDGRQKLENFYLNSQVAAMAQEYKLILKYADEPGYTPDIECYLRHGGYEDFEEGLAIPPKDLPDGKKAFAAGTDSRGRQNLRPARSRRRRFFLRAEMELRGSQERQADLS
jgi:hypothetical protein